MNNNEILKNLYYNPKTGLTILNIFKKTVKKLNPDITGKEIENLYKNLETVQILKKPIIKKENFLRIVDEALTF